MLDSGHPKSDNPHRRHHAGEEGPTAKEREYLEVIYYLASRNEPVIAARLARCMGVQPPTVTHVLKQLEDKKHLITRDARGEIHLTPEGFTLAESQIRKKYGVTVVGVKSAGEDFTYAVADTRVGSNDVLIVSGHSELIEKFAARP